MQALKPMFGKTSIKSIPDYMRECHPGVSDFDIYWTHALPAQASRADTIAAMIQFLEVVQGELQDKVNEELARREAVQAA